MKGYKVFDPDWTCRGFKFEVGNTYTEDVKPECCHKGFHFCTEITDCFEYYPFNPHYKIAEVEALGDIDASNKDSKCCTNKIRIVKEITWYEALDLVNLGESCTGLRNSGNYNSGYYNSGDSNSGNRNSGNRNSGDRNSGNRNSGNDNKGSWNSGNHNTGNGNSGNWNSGLRNSGDWNKTSHSNGCFNTESPKIFLFNKLSDWTYQDWMESYARYILVDCPASATEWVFDFEMTNEEKEQHPEYSLTGGFLGDVEDAGERQAWWDNLAKMSKDTIMSLPNFDKDIFKEITGIDVDGGDEDIT